MAVLQLLLLGATALLLIPILLLSAEVLLAATGRRQPASPAAARPSLTVIVPAHDEASIIAATLQALQPQLTASDRLVVVADNCSDDTAGVAASVGAEVLVRADPDRRGKGYALDFGIRHLALSPPQVVLVIDADCRIERGSLGELAAAAVALQRPVQAQYLIRAPEGAGTMTRIAEFACVVKNLVRPSGARRLGLPCQLMGSGMAFPWAIISKASLASGALVEDVRLGSELVRARVPPFFLPQVLVTSDFPRSEEGVRSQRTRWEHGNLGVALFDAPRLLVRALLARDALLAGYALDLSVPPLALLTLGMTALWICNAVVVLLDTHRWLGFALANLAILTLGVSIVLAWDRYGRGIVSLRDLGFASLYALRKLPLYARFVFARQRDWVRSKRD